MTRCSVWDVPVGPTCRRPAPASYAASAAGSHQLQQTVRQRGLRYLHRHGLLERHVTDDMLTSDV